MSLDFDVNSKFRNSEFEIKRWQVLLLPMVLKQRTHLACVRSCIVPCPFVLDFVAHAVCAGSIGMSPVQVSSQIADFCDIPTS
jgi:hypothetical protein